jgi:hypothetical protein
MLNNVAHLRGAFTRYHVSAWVHAAKRLLDQKRTRVEVLKMGSTDETTPWATTRKLLCDQLLLQFTGTKDECDAAGVSRRQLAGVLWLDEKHQEQVRSLNSEPCLMLVTVIVLVRATRRSL